MKLQDLVYNSLSNPTADGMLIQDQEEEGSGEYSDNEPDMDQGNAVYRNDNVESILHTPEEMDQESNKLIEENRINYNELFYNQSPNDRE